MLSISNVSSGMALQYFTQDDYYASQDGKIEIFGRTFENMGIKNGLTRDQFSYLLDGLNPNGKGFLAPQKSSYGTSETIQKAFDQLDSDLEQKIQP